MAWEKIVLGSGTSSQFIKGDGSLDSSTYSTSSHTHSYLPLSGGTLTGNLTTNGQIYSSSSTLQIRGAGGTPIIYGVSGATYLYAGNSTTTALTLQAGHAIAGSGFAYGGVNNYTKIIDGATGALTGTSATFSGGVTINEGGGDNDFRIESDHNENILHIQADGQGAASTQARGRVSFGSATGGGQNCFFRVGGFINSWYGGGEQSGALFNSGVTAHTSDTSGTHFNNQIYEGGSGTHPMLAGVKITAPAITAGSASTTNTASLYITGAPSATVTGGNYTIYAPSGTNYFGGNVNIGQSLGINGAFQGHKIIELSEGRTTDPAYYKLNLPQHYWNSNNDNGGHVRIMVVWQAGHASSSHTKIIEFTYGTHHGRSADGYLEISGYEISHESDGVDSYGGYGITPTLSLYRGVVEDGSGYCGAILKVTGLNANYNKRIHIRAEVTGDSVLAPTLTSTGSTLETGAVLISPSDKIFSEKVGIGTSSPEADLHISNASPAILFEDEDVSNLKHKILGGGNTGLEYAVDINNVGAGYHRWDCGGAERMRLIEGGFLGIGSTAATAPLQVRMASPSGGQRMLDITAGSTNILSAVYTSGNTILRSSGTLSFDTNASNNQALALDTSGNATFAGLVTSPTLTVSGQVYMNNIDASQNSHLTLNSDYQSNYNVDINGVAFTGNGNGSFTGNISLTSGKNITSGNMKMYIDASAHSTSASYATFESLSDRGIDIRSQSQTRFYTDNANTLSLTLDSSQNATFAGTINSGAITSSGNVTASRYYVQSGGNATDPMIRVTGDDHTGIYFPSGDTLAFSTGGVERGFISGSGKLDWAGDADFGGNVGIGTTAPADPLHIYAAGGSTINFDTNGASNWRVGATTTGGGYSTGNAFAWYCFDNTSYKMTLTTGGNLGIGTASPNQKLTVSSGHISIDDDYRLVFGGSTNTSIFGSTANTYLRFYTGSAERVRINNTGVGIGITAPTSLLHIQSNDSTTNVEVDMLTLTALSTGTTTTGFGPAIKFQAERNNGVMQNVGKIRSIAEVNAGTNISSGLAFETGTVGALNESMRITYDGKVGIGTTSPDYALDVAGDIGVDEYIYRNGDANTHIQFAADRVKISAGGESAFDYDESSASTLDIAKSGEADISLGGGNVFVGGSHGSYDENVGIGTTSPSTKLDVSGVVTASSFIGERFFLSNRADFRGATTNKYVPLTGNYSVNASAPSDSIKYLNGYYWIVPYNCTLDYVLLASEVASVGNTKITIDINGISTLEDETMNVASKDIAYKFQFNYTLTEGHILYMQIDPTNTAESFTYTLVFVTR